MTDAATTTIPVETAEQLLHDLVAMPSLSYNEAGAVRLLVDWMSSHGYDDAFVDEAGNAIGIVGSGDGSRD
ncbi:MAG: acetyl-lysine deacetylase, partial [Chloroflexota bacterium]